MMKKPLGVCDRLLSAHAKDRHSWTPEWAICADMCVNWRPVEASASAAPPAEIRSFKITVRPWEASGGSRVHDEAIFVVGHDARTALLNFYETENYDWKEWRVIDIESAPKDQTQAADASDSIAPLQVPTERSVKVKIRHAGELEMQPVDQTQAAIEEAVRVVADTIEALIHVNNVGGEINLDRESRELLDAILPILRSGK